MVLSTSDKQALLRRLIIESVNECDGDEKRTLSMHELAPGVWGVVDDMMEGVRDCSLYFDLNCAERKETTGEEPLPSYSINEDFGYGYLRLGPSMINSVLERAKGCIVLKGDITWNENPTPIDLQ